MIEINTNAPVHASADVNIAASPEMIWDIMLDVDKWPEWNPDIKWVDLEGKLDVGSEFRWKSGPGSIKSTIRRLEKPHIIAWTGKTLGIYAIHVWKLEMSNGSTNVKTEESWEGLVTHIFGGLLENTLEKAIKNGLQYLKDEAERRTKI